MAPPAPVSRSVRGSPTGSGSSLKAAPARVRTYKRPSMVVTYGARRAATAGSAMAPAGEEEEEGPGPRLPGVGVPSPSSSPSPA